MPSKKRLSSTVRKRHSGSVSKTTKAKIAGADVPIRESDVRVPVDSLQEIVNPAYVRVGGGITKRTENEFEFVRVDVSVEWPCEPNKKAAKKTYDLCAAMVDEMIQEELEYAEDRLDD